MYLQSGEIGLLPDGDLRHGTPCSQLVDGSGGGRSCPELDKAKRLAKDEERGGESPNDKGFIGQTCEYIFIPGLADRGRFLEVRQGVCLCELSPSVGRYT